MGAITIRRIRFNVYPNDHDSPHVDVEIDGLKMQIAFGTEKQPPEVIKKNSRIRRPDATRALDIFQDNQEELKKLYDKVHAEIRK